MVMFSEKGACDVSVEIISVKVDSDTECGVVLSIEEFPEVVNEMDVEEEILGDVSVRDSVEDNVIGVNEDPSCEVPDDECKDVKEDSVNPEDVDSEFELVTEVDVVPSHEKVDWDVVL